MIACFLLFYEDIHTFLGQCMLHCFFYISQKIHAKGEPSYSSDARNGKHKDVVWQVRKLVIINLFFNNKKKGVCLDGTPTK